MVVKVCDEFVKCDVFIGVCGDYDFYNEVKELSNDLFVKGVLDGVGFYYVGFLWDDCEVVEEWFKEGKI